MSVNEIGERAPKRVKLQDTPETETENSTANGRTHGHNELDEDPYGESSLAKEVAITPSDLYLDTVSMPLLHQSFARLIQAIRNRLTVHCLISISRNYAAYR